MNPHGVNHQILSLARLPGSATLAITNDDPAYRLQVTTFTCGMERACPTRGWNSLSLVERRGGTRRTPCGLPAAGTTLSGRSTRARVGSCCKFGEPCRDRTYDPLIKSQLLYQLS